jgi:hypothetical protein
MLKGAPDSISFKTRRSTTDCAPASSRGAEMTSLRSFFGMLDALPLAPTGERSPFNVRLFMGKRHSNSNTLIYREGFFLILQ